MSTTSDWREKSKRRLLTISASQLESYEVCRRKWWFRNVRKLPDRPSSSQIFGTVLHSVCERFLRADDQGRDRQSGLPVELYPDGWHKALGRDGKESGEGEVSLQEQGQIKSLIDAAIESGVLQRLPGREIERQFNRKVIDGEGKGTTIMLTGLIDVMYPDGIQDHKTSKSIRYLKNDKPNSDNYLGKNTQMLTYAHELLATILDMAMPIPPKVYLRHNQFVKDDQQTRVIKTEVWVTPDQIEDHWQQVEQTAVQMEQLRHNIDAWQQIADPPNLNKACMAFGGCPYRTICGGQETCEQMENRLDKSKQEDIIVPLTITGRIQLQQLISNGEHTMPVDFNSRLANRSAIGAAAAHAVALPVAIPIPAPAPVAVKVAKATPKVFTPDEIVKMQTDAGTVPPPWATADCTACAGLGFNTVGSPCRICDNDRVQAEQAPSTMFTITPVQDGIVDWKYHHDQTVQGQSINKAPLPLAPKQQERVEPTQPEPTPAAKAPVPAAPAAPAPIAKAAEEDDEVESDGKPSRGRPSKGFMLLVNCAVIRGALKKNTGRYVHNLNSVMAQIGEDMAKQNNVESFYKLDVFARRDAIAAYAPKLVEVFGADIVIATGVGRGASDIKALVDALRPLAGCEVMAEAD